MTLSRNPSQVERPDDSRKMGISNDVPQRLRGKTVPKKEGSFSSHATNGSDKHPETQFVLKNLITRSGSTRDLSQGKVASPRKDGLLQRRMLSNRSPVGSPARLSISSVSNDSSPDAKLSSPFSATLKSVVRKGSRRFSQAKFTSQTDDDMSEEEMTVEQKIAKLYPDMKLQKEMGVGVAFGEIALISDTTRYHLATL